MSCFPRNLHLIQGQNWWRWSRWRCRCRAGGAALQVGLGGPWGRHQPAVRRHGRTEERLHAHRAAHAGGPAGRRRQVGHALLPQQLPRWSQAGRPRPPHRHLHHLQRCPQQSFLSLRESGTSMVLVRSRVWPLVSHLRLELLHKSVELWHKKGMQFENCCDWGSHGF